MMRTQAVVVVALLLALPLAAAALEPPTATGPADPLRGAGPAPPTDAAGWAPADPASAAEARIATARFVLPAGTAAFTVRMEAGGQPVDVRPVSAVWPRSALPAGPELALCAPSEQGLHYTTTPDQHETCPFTRHDGPIHESTLVCAVGGDCTLAGQDVPTDGTFWVICFAASGSAQAWGTLDEVDVQCDSGRSGPPPHTWTRWSSWCRVFGLTSGAALCAHTYG